MDLCFLLSTGYDIEEIFLIAEALSGPEQVNPGARTFVRAASGDLKAIHFELPDEQAA